MSDDHGERIATLEGILSQTLPRIEQYMLQGVAVRIEGNKSLSNLESAVVNLKDYQENCDKERKELRTKQIGTDARLDSLESSRRRQIAVCLGLGAFAGWLVEGGSKVIGKAMEFFNG